MSALKRVSVREFLGRIWEQEKFNLVQVWNEFDELQVNWGKGTHGYFELCEKHLRKGETLDVESEFSIQEWSFNVIHTITADCLPHYKPQ